MVDSDRSVVRFNDGSLLKGYVKDFSPYSREITLEEAKTGEIRKLMTDNVKAVFFVKSFEGDIDYREKKSYGMRKPTGKRAFVKFKDGECFVGFLDGKVPWEKGFFLTRKARAKRKGFFLLPADEDANNIKVFVISTSVDDVTIVPQTH